MLIIIDPQVDFFEGGKLAVPFSNKIIPNLEELILRSDNFIVSQDWHPKDHISFASNHNNKQIFDKIQIGDIEQTLWPNHCIMGSDGARVNPRIDTTKSILILRKGSNKNIDSYSIFYENDKQTSTGLEGYLKSKNIEKITLCGLAFDYCVAWSALDGSKLGFKTEVIKDATAYIDEEVAKAKTQEMVDSSIKLISTKDYLANL